MSLTGMAAATATVTLTALIAFVHTEVRCPRCRSLLMVIPGQVEATVRIVPSRTGTGTGRVIVCHRSGCRHRVEVTER